MNVEIIERLREAAKDHGEVSDLLDWCRQHVAFSPRGNPVFVDLADKAEVSYLRDVLAAADFAAFDRKAN